MLSSAARRGNNHVSEELVNTFRRSVEEGAHRIGRSWPSLFATGAVGGVDISAGVLGMLVVEERTHNPLLAGLAFGIGFIALTLANSELFTENFLVPVVAVAAGRAGPLALMRLWGGTAVTNLFSGWILMGLIVVAVPEVRRVAVELGSHYADVGARQGAAAAVLGGAVITLMTWMERGTDSMPAKLVAAVSAAFLLVAGKLNHAIVVSLLMFAGLHAGAPYGYADWGGVLALATAGNIVGGLGLVTILRLVQVGRERLVEERSRSEADERGAGPGPDAQSSERTDAAGATGDVSPARPRAGS